MNDDQHCWAAYSLTGEVLETGNKTRELDYWLYKAKLPGTVGPYPDRDRPMLPLTTPCDRCDGTGHDHGRVHMMPLDPEGNPVHLPDFVIDTTREHETQTCPFCKGLLFLTARGRDFRSASALKGAQTKGTAIQCEHCRGVGTVAYVPIVEDCYSCSGRGTRPTWDPTRPVLPPEVSVGEHATREFMEAWLNTITITVVRFDQGLTWGESFLGFMGLGSCTDYGERWNRDDDTPLIWEVVEDLLNSPPQFAKLLNGETRVIGHALMIRLTTNGYTPIVVGAPVVHGLGALPPTYFPTVFEELR